MCHLFVVNFGAIMSGSDLGNLVFESFWFQTFLHCISRKLPISVLYCFKAIFKFSYIDYDLSSSLRQTLYL